jgi:glycosidase
MLKFWIKTYGVDGFRFDCVDDPDGPGRMIPADFWLEVGQQLRSVNPDVLLLGECDTPDLANKPFTLEYGWRMYSAIKDAGNNGDASVVQDIWYSQNKEFPNDFRHMGISDDWDCARDVNTFGGPAGAQAAAVFDFTDTCIPLIHNGMEVGNSAGASGSHIPIDWVSGDQRFTSFYRDLIKLRRDNIAFQTGEMNWLANSQPKQTFTYERSGGGSDFLIEINLSNSTSIGTVLGTDDKGWIEVHLTGAANSADHTAPQKFSLGPRDFAIFRRAEQQK